MPNRLNIAKEKMPNMYLKGRATSVRFPNKNVRHVGKLF